MGKSGRNLKTEAQKRIAQLIGQLSNKFSEWEIWQNFIVMSAISIANVFDSPYRDEREKMYMDIAQKYTAEELQVFTEMLAVVVEEMERNPEQDTIGDMFMGLGFNSEQKGQFFTPYHICRLMAAMTSGPDLKEQIDKTGWFCVNDPACGAGALLIAFANECRRQDVNFQTSVLFVAQDLDFLAGMMCYIQLSLLGCPGYIVIGNTITNPSLSIDRHGLIPVESSSVWYTPMYHSDLWQIRRLLAKANLLPEDAEEEETDEKD